MQRVLDTNTEADRIQHEIWASMSASERSAQALALSRLLLESSRSVIDATNQAATSDERLVLYVAAQYGPDLAERVRIKLATRTTGRGWS
jgi:hypothetical protein